MKKILIDLGNTCLKWAIKTEQGISNSHSIYYQHQDFQILLEQAWGLLEIDQVVLASVAEESLNTMIIEFARLKWNIETAVLKTGLEACGLRNHYATPLLLGVDRWAAAVAAWIQYQSPLCLVSCGTALTSDIIDEAGCLVGGTISPGLSFMCQSLSQRAAQLKSFDQNFFKMGETYSPVLEAKDTLSAMQNGALLMSIAFLNQTVETLWQKYGTAMRFIIRGGDAIFLLPHLKSSFLYQEDLVLQGIDLLSQDVK
jgi:type III pantothenate kinase